MKDLIIQPFTDQTRDLASRCAEWRLETARFARDKFGQNSHESHYHGALGEIAFYRFMGVKWKCDVRKWSAPDLGDFEIRAVGPLTRWYVKTKVNDQAHIVASIQILSACEAAEIMGWITVEDIKRLGKYEDWGNRGAPAWMLRDKKALSLDFKAVPVFETSQST